ncbi:MAG: DUF1080 domain-containing protein, partial [Verrucomicrobiota bacterium]
MRLTLFVLICFAACLAGARSTELPRDWVGRWSFHLPDGYPVWLELDEAGQGKLLWAVGSAREISDLELLSGSRLRFQRRIKYRPYGREIGLVATGMEAQLDHGAMRLSVGFVREGSAPLAFQSVEMVGVRLSPFPNQPDLDQLEFGEPIVLIESGSPEATPGWELTDPAKSNGWRMDDGVLVNETPKEDFSAFGGYGNLRTVETFHDFEIRYEYRVPPNGNSGVYLRGAYELQVVDRDSKMQGINGPGAVFGRIEPSENAGRPGGEWNTVRAILVDQHITLELNGVTVIDNQLIGMRTS